jgi:hypothetical protein
MHKGVETLPDKSMTNNRYHHKRTRQRTNQTEI